MASTPKGNSALAPSVSESITAAGAGITPVADSANSEAWPIVSLQSAHNLGKTYSSLASVTDTSVPTLYKMCGMDANTLGLYDTWIVPNAPDYAGTYYTGSRATPLRCVYISGQAHR